MQKSNSQPEDEDSDIADWDDWQDSANAPTKSLFDETVLDDPLKAIAYSLVCASVVPSRSTPSLPELDSYGRIRLINYIRKKNLKPAQAQALSKSSPFISDDDAYLIPTLLDDGLLQLDMDDEDFPRTEGQIPDVINTNQPKSLNELQERVCDLEKELQESRKAVAEVQALMKKKFELADDREIEAGPSTTKNFNKVRDDDSHYFDSYGYQEIHEIMIKDTIRTDAYYQFVKCNADLFKDKVVLDVGCGTGILSMFVAQAGAKGVYAVDASSVAMKAKSNIQENGFDTKIQYESMLDSIIYARDNFLNSSGLMVPSQCNLKWAALEGNQLYGDKVSFWDNVYGLKMSSMKDGLIDEAMLEILSPESVLSPSISLKNFLMQSCTLPDLEFEQDFRLEISRSGTMRGFTGWFDTYFTLDSKEVIEEPSMGPTEISFTTGPLGKPTHWKQCAFWLKEVLSVVRGDTIIGQFKLNKNPNNSRELEVQVTFVKRSISGSSEMIAQVWQVG